MTLPLNSLISDWGDLDHLAREIQRCWKLEA